MPTAIGIRLLSECYAACPWDTAHVEGIVEFPPSSWRIYRAIFAGFFLAFDAGRKVNREDIEEIISILATTLPDYYLPQSTYVQTRTNRKDLTDDTRLYKSGKKLVSGELRFHPNDCTIYIHWNVELNKQQIALLDTCLNFCAYLGRRESDAVWQIEDGELPQINCHPDTRGNIKTLVPGDDFEPKHLLKSPREIFDIQRKQHIPGAKWTSYISTTSKQILECNIPIRKFNYIKVALVADFPLRDRSTLYFSEKLHDALVSKCSSTNFTGCDEFGNYLRSNNHVYLVPVIEKRQIIAFEFYCANGFTLEEERAFITLRKLYSKSGEITLRLVAMGKWSDYSSPSKVWQSSTPMFLPRYPATSRGKPKMLQQSNYQKDCPEHQALKLLLHLPQFELNKNKDIQYKPTGFGLEQWIDGELFCRSQATLFTKHWQWKSDRVNGKKTVNQGYWLKLSFARPQFAPIAIGHAAHFGLGVFTPAS